MLATKRAQILSISERLLWATAISRPPLPLPHLTSPPPHCNISLQFTSAGDDKISFFGTAIKRKFVEVGKVGIILYKCKTIKQLKQVHLRMLINGIIDDDNCNYLADKIILLTPDLISFDYAYNVFIYLSSNLNLSPYNNLIKWSIGKSDYLPVSVYNRMRYQDNISPDRFTFGFLFKSFASFDWDYKPKRHNRLKSGKTVHGHVIKLGFGSDTFVMNSLLEFYFRFVNNRHQLRAVRKVFEQMPERDIASWNAMISGLLNSDLFSEALLVFNDMLLLADDRCKPDETTLINIISNKGIFVSSDLGKWLDAYIKENKLVLSLPLGNALLNMFVYYNDLGNAKVVFKSMSKKSTYTWNLMITLLVRNKFYKEALLLFDIMCCCSEEEGGLFIFHTILSTFESDPSLVGDGERLFRAIYKMMYVFGVKPDVDIFLELIHILTQVGWLEAAKIVAKIVEEISPFHFRMEYISLDEVKEMASTDVSAYPHYSQEDKFKAISLTEEHHAQEKHPVLEDDVYKVAENLSRQLLDLHDQMVSITV
ncbi:hypothetical protein CASFOL_003781 [Castilleja foliolosa]|uniref:Pentatricopeptide repeat-containing protein n=1 Tax=Castilleja foliolosa TaxID=1961234 RepID=A0ABD3ELX9_9LAMI